MQGIELSRIWFEKTVFPFLQKELPEVLPFLAAGLSGHGSECFGFDDEISRDHDFTAGVSLWLTDEAESKFGFQLKRLSEKLLKEKKLPVTDSQESRMNQSEHGISTIEDFFLQHIGLPGAPVNWRQWLYTPEYAFAEAVNGEVFYDAPGIFTAIRKTILESMPEDVRLKKMAARAALMAQSGQYNYTRCLKHGERGAAMLALGEFVRAAVSMIFLLNRRYTPYYKWMFRGLRGLPKLPELAEPLEFLLTESSPQSMTEELVNDIVLQIENELRRQDVSESKEIYLEPHAFSMMEKIRNQEIRSLHVMEG